MAEYIDREAAKEILREFERVCTAFGVNPEQVRGIRYSQYELNRVPAADVEEVKHGRWLWDEFNAGYYCPHCVGIYWKSPDVPNAFKRCPNCGAKMDGGKETDV